MPMVGLQSVIVAFPGQTGHLIYTALGLHFLYVPNSWKKYISHKWLIIELVITLGN